MTTLPKELKELKKAYNRVFSSEDGELILADLRKVCFIGETTLHELAHMMSFQEGHRAVFLHILSRMNLENVIKDEQQTEEPLNV